MPRSQCALMPSSRGVQRSSRHGIESPGSHGARVDAGACAPWHRGAFVAELPGSSRWRGRDGAEVRCVGGAAGSRGDVGPRGPAAGRGDDAERLGRSTTLIPRRLRDLDTWGHGGPWRSRDLGAGGALVTQGPGFRGAWGASIGWNRGTRGSGAPSRLDRHGTKAPWCRGAEVVEVAWWIGSHGASADLVPSRPRRLGTQVPSSCGCRGGGGAQVSGLSRGRGRGCALVLRARKFSPRRGGARGAGGLGAGSTHGARVAGVCDACFARACGGQGRLGVADGLRGVR
jgi:hypothetical protein